MTTTQFITKIQGMTTKENLAIMTKDAKMKLEETILETLATKKLNDTTKTEINKVLKVLQADLAKKAPKATKEKAPAKAPEKPAVEKKALKHTTVQVEDKPVKADKKADKKPAPFKHDHDLKVNEILKFKEKTKKATFEREFKILQVDPKSNMILAQNVEAFEDVSVFIVEAEGNRYMLEDVVTKWNAIAQKL